MEKWKLSHVASLHVLNLVKQAPELSNTKLSWCDITLNVYKMGACLSKHCSVAPLVARFHSAALKITSTPLLYQVIIS